MAEARPAAARIKGRRGGGAGSLATAEEEQRAAEACEEEASATILLRKRSGARPRSTRMRRRRRPYCGGGVAHRCYGSAQRRCARGHGQGPDASAAYGRGESSAGRARMRAGGIQLYIPSAVGYPKMPHERLVIPIGMVSGTRWRLCWIGDFRRFPFFTDSSTFT